MSAHDTPAATAEAVAMLRSGAAPAVAWRDAFGTDLEADVEGPSPRAAAARLSRSTGAPLADVLAEVAHLEARRRGARLASEAATAGARASAAALQLLPVAGAGIAVAVEPATFRLLTQTPLGWALVAAAVALAALGRAWTGRMVARAAVVGSAWDQLALAVVLTKAALAGGLPVASAVAAAGGAQRDLQGAELAAVAARLEGGSAWASAWDGVAPSTAAVGRALRPAAFAGASAGPTLDALAVAAHQEARSERERAAGELGVRVTLPLALCFLPAFALVGVVPLVIALAAGVGLPITIGGAP